MDSYHQSHPYMRAPPPPPPPPPPSTADPYQHHHHQQSSLRPPIPPQGPWFPNQFQYHPSPPPWGPPLPNSDHAPPPPGSYSAPPPPHPYPTPPSHHNQFPPPPPPPRPHMFPYPPPPPHSQVPQSYSHVNQEWNNQNWSSHQSWDYQAHSNEEDWAAKARAWADAKTAMENQQSQFPPTGRIEEQHYYHDQYSQQTNSNHPDMSHQPPPPTTYEQFPSSATSVLRPPAAHYPESMPVSSEPSPYLSDVRPTYSVSDGNIRSNMNTVLNHQGKLPLSPSVHQQEVPSSNFSVPGKEDMVDQSEQSYNSMLLQNASVQEGHQHFQPSVPTPYAYGNQSADLTTNLADQPLDFAPRFSYDHGLRMQSGYARNDSAGSTRGIDSGVTTPSLTPWTSIAPGMVYPQIPPLLTSGTQQDPPVAMPSSVTGHTPPPFGRFPGSGMTPAIPSAAVPFAGTALPTTVLSGDTYGLSNMPERPKKASVPNWLREEIKKAVITSSSADHPKEDTELMEDQGVDKSFAKGDQTDSKSVDSSRSTEEEEDEDYVDGARTAAINQEIKRVLTEVLLKVTDELFDEIATKVINEDDLAIEVKHNVVSTNQNVSPSPLPATTPKSSAKVLVVPVKVQEPYSDTDGTNEKSIFSSPGDVLGLANYDSDDENNDDKDGEIQSSNVPSTKTDIDIESSSIKKLPENIQDAARNASTPVDVVQHIGNHIISESNAGATSSINEISNRTDVNKLNGHWVDGEMGQEYTLKSSSKDKVYGVKLGGGTASRTKDTSGIVSEHHVENVKGFIDPEGGEIKMKSDNNGKQESARGGSSRKDHLKEEEINTRINEKTDENRRKQDQRHPKKEETVDQNVQKEISKDQVVKTGEKGKDSELRHRSTRHNSKEGRREDKLLRASVKDGTDRKREYTKDKEEGRSRQKLSSDSSRHKSSRDRNKDKTVDRSTNSSDDSDDSKRKVNSRKRDKSPSPIRSKRRQVSRSPHSKHSQRRHSPFSSLETTRARRSRSRSPVRRRR